MGFETHGLPRYTFGEFCEPEFSINCRRRPPRAQQKPIRGSLENPAERRRMREQLRQDPSRRRFDDHSRSGRGTSQIRWPSASSSTHTVLGLAFVEGAPARGPADVGSCWDHVMRSGFSAPLWCGVTRRVCPGSLTVGLALRAWGDFSVGTFHLSASAGRSGRSSGSTSAATWNRTR